jgi:hypothetical protein
VSAHASAVSRTQAHAGDRPSPTSDFDHLADVVLRFAQAVEDLLGGELSHRFNMGSEALRWRKHSLGFRSGPSQLVERRPPKICNGLQERRMKSDTSSQEPHTLLVGFERL